MLQDHAPTLLRALGQCELPLALFDSADMLRRANAAYESTFLRGLALPVSFANMLRHGFSHSFGIRITSGDVEGFLADILPRRRSATCRTHLTDTVDGRWLQITETLLSDGWLLAVAADITLLKHHERTIAQARDSAIQASLTDALTGVANRRHIMALAEGALSARRASEHPVGLVLVGIDHFKTIKDTRGRLDGDQVLVAFSAECRRQLRPNDSVGRVGEEEFLLCWQAPLRQPRTRSSNVYVRIARPHARCPTRSPQGLWSPSLGSRSRTSLRRAETALYAAKQGGRNRSAVAARASGERLTR